MHEVKPPAYDLTTREGQAQYRDAVEQRARKWAENFEHGGGGDGPPYQAGDGLDLWLVLIERWPREFGEQAVSTMALAEELGASACELVISELVSRRTEN